MSKKLRKYPQWFIEELVDPETKQKALEGTLSTVSKVEFKCTCGNTYIQKITNHINLSTGERRYGNCPNCSKKIRAEKYRESIGTYKSYPQWFIDELVNEEDKEKALSGELKAEDKISFVCSVCGNVYIQRVASHITLSTGEKKKGCPKCGVKKQVESSRKTKEIIKLYPQWFIDDLYNEEDREKAKTTNFYGNEEKQFYCKKHNIVYIQRVKHHIDLKTHQPKAGCPECKIEKFQDTLSISRKYPQWFIEDLYLEEDKQRALYGGLKSTDVVKFYCSKHKEVYCQVISSHININSNERKRGCPKCGRDLYLDSLSENRIYPQWFIDELVNEEDKQKAKEGSLTTTEYVDFICKRGHIYKQQVKNHIILSRQERYKGCPQCFPNRSKEELEVESYIRSLGLVTEHKRICVENKQLEIDIFIPEKNIGIEYNGSFYHRTLPKVDFSKDRMYHNTKFWYCKELGIRLISIFDVDWWFKKEKIKRYLSDLLTSTSFKIAARKCELRQVDYYTANAMYEEYHLLGKTTNITVSYGLFYDSQLISCMSFQKGRYKKDNKAIWCLTRFVTKSGFSITGGASRLLKKFDKDFNPSLLVSYSDNDYFTGNVYSKLGFDCLGDTKSPRYYWFLNNKEYKREQCQLKSLSKQYPELFEESKYIRGNKEDYIMLKLGAYKVYRSGQIKWIKKY